MKPEGSMFGTIGTRAKMSELTQQQQAKMRAEVKSHYDDYRASGREAERYNALKLASRRTNPCGHGREH